MGDEPQAVGADGFSLLCFPKNLQKRGVKKARKSSKQSLRPCRPTTNPVRWCFRVFPNVADVGAFEAGLAAAREALATSRQSEQEAQASKQRVCYMPATRIVARFVQKVRKKLSSNKAQMNMICQKKLSSRSGF